MNEINRGVRKLVSHWARNSIKNIRPLSTAQDWLLALNEWAWTGNYREVFLEVCGLCEHPHLRYIFEIYNPLTGNTLWVGSECIKKFIRHHSTKGYLTPAEMGREVNRTIRDAEEQKEQNRKDRVWALINVLLNTLKHLNRHKWMRCVEDAFSLRDMFFVLDVFNEYEIPASFGDFRICIQKTDDRYIECLTSEDYKLFRPAFSKSWQQKLDSKFNLPDGQ